MNLSAEKLYKLLPAVYRIRDYEQGGPLKALLTVLAEQGRIVESDINRLNENWFIETCEEWVVPYIGDLLGVRGIHSVIDGSVFSQRARIANTLSYRRRKGTATVLEQLALDTTGWRARAVEFFELLGTTQNNNHIRLHNQRTPDLRLTNELELLNTAFDEASHTVDVRHIKNNRGRHNIPNIGLFVWRLQSYPVVRSSARQVLTSPPVSVLFTFSPLGHDMPLFNRPQTEEDITHLAEEINVPGLLRRRPLYDELEARRQAMVDGRTPEYIYFDDLEKSKANPVLKVFINGSETPIPPEEILICNLEDWHIPENKKAYESVDQDGSVTKIERPIQVAVDPLLGRLSFPSSITVDNALVSYSYGFSGDVGGGPYNRHESVYSVLNRKVTWQVGVTKEPGYTSGSILPTLTEAVTRWNQEPDGTVGVIAILDSYTYEESLTGINKIKIPEGSQLLIVAAGWPEEDVPGGLPGVKHRVPGKLGPDKLRPHILGNIEVEGAVAGPDSIGGRVILNGLLVEGKLTVLSGDLGNLQVVHSTLVPGKGGLEVTSGNKRLSTDLIRSICGLVKINGVVSKLHIKESIIDSRTGNAIQANKTAVELLSTTVFGGVKALKIEASNCIFTKKVNIERRQEGCIRFSFVPDKSKTPRRFHCQPDLAIKEAPSSEHVKILARLVPSFTSVDYGHYAYAQLSQTCPEEIVEGADDGSEMGVFNFLKQPQRVKNLRTGLDEYLRFGLEAGIICVT